MSGKVVGWAMEQKTGSPITKLVLLKLADNAGEHGYSWPSVSLVISHTELGQATVYKHLDLLQKLGLIEPKEIPNALHGVPGYAGALTGWRLNIPIPDEIPPYRKSKKLAPRSGTKILRGGIALSIEKEPSLNLPMRTAGGHRLAALPLNGRGEALAKLIGDREFETYFRDSKLIDGSFPTIVMPSEFKAHRAWERYGTALRRVFGDSMQVICDVPEGEICHEKADPQPWWASDP